MADFKFYLSRQGPKGEPGAKGEKGDNGNTPTFSDGINTPTVYTMQIDMGDGNVFETQNLKYPMRDDGGNYLRYDRTNSTVTLSAPNIADLQRTSGEVTLASVNDVENEDAQDTDAVSMELRNADQSVLNNRINNLDNSKADKSDVYTKTQTDTLLNGKANTVHTHNLSQITDAGSLAGKNTVDYNTEVTNKPTIGNGTITITQGGVTKGTFTTNQSGNSTIELDAGGGGGTTYTAGPGITINQNDEISANVDNNTIVIDGNSLKANIPDVSNFVTNSSLATTLQSYPTNTQLANTLEAYPTNNGLSNAITYQTVSVPSPATYTFDRTMSLYLSEYSMDPNVEKDGVWTKVGTSTYTRDKQLVIPSEASYDNGLWVTILNLQETECVKCISGYTFSFESNPQIAISYYDPEQDTLISKRITVNTSSDEVFEISSSSYGYTTLNMRVLKNIYIKWLMVQYSYDSNGQTPSVFLAPLFNSNGEVEVYTRGEGTPITTTKAVIANTAVDGTTIGVSTSGQLQSLVDMTQYYTKTQVNSLVTPALIVDTQNQSTIVNPVAINTNNQLSVVTDSSGANKLTLSGDAAIGVEPINIYNNPILGYYPWDADESSNVVTINNNTGQVTFSNDVTYSEDSGQIYARNTFIPNNSDGTSFMLQFTTGSNVSNVASSDSAILYADTDGYFYYTLKISENHFVVSVPTSGITKEEFTLSGYLVEADTPYSIVINKDLNQTNTFNVFITNQNNWTFYSDSVTTTATPSFPTFPTVLNLSRQGYGVLTSIDLGGSNFPPGLNRVIVDKQMQIGLSYDPETLELEYGALKVKPSIDGGTL